MASNKKPQQQVSESANPTPMESKAQQWPPKPSQQHALPSPFQQPQQPSPFQPQQQNPFQQQQVFQFQQQLPHQQPSPSPFQPQQQPQQSSPFQPQQQNPFRQQRLVPSQFQPQQELILFTNDKTPATHSTKWADLHPDSQKLLLQIEDRVLEYRDERRLDQWNGLDDSSVSIDGFEIDAAQIAQDLVDVVKDLLKDVEETVRSFMMLHHRFLHPNMGGSSHPVAPNQQRARFVKDLGECCQKVENIHQYIESMKTAHLADQRHQPFREVDQRETAKQEAAARRVQHPTLHLPVNTHLSTQAAGLLPSSSNAWKSTGSQTTFNSQPSAPSSSLFAAAAACPQTSLFTASSSALFGPATTPSLFWSFLPHHSLFSTPFASGVPTGSGASFGAASKSTFNSQPSAPSFFQFATPTSSAAAASWPSPQISLFTASSSSLFSTPSLLGSFTTSFGTPTSAGASLFSTPLTPGSPTESADSSKSAY